MSDASDQLAAIIAARNTGVLSVKHMDTWTTFRNLEDMNAIIATLQQQVNAENGIKRRGPIYITQRRKAL